MLRRKPIVVVGSINIDLVSKAARIPVKGETITGLDFQIHPGGKGANQAVAIARLGYPVRLIAKLGNDVFGTQLRAHLQDAGVDTAAVGETSGSSGSAVIVVSPEGENVIIVNPGANAALTAEDIDANLGMIREAGIVLTQLEVPLETVERLAEVCAREGVPLLLDPAPATELPPGLIGRARWFTPNETEAAFYSGCDDGISPRETARLLLDQGWPAVALKLGARGVYLAEQGGNETEISSFPVHALDTTAAGDAFNGTFATGMMLGMTATDSARLGAAAAAISVTRSGAQPSMPTMEEVERMLKVSIA